ncbi:MAG: TonB-dependent receptor [Rhodanobacter sp.]
MNYRKTLLAASIITGLCLSGAVFAQDSAQSADSSTTQTAGQRARAAQEKDATQLVGVTVVGIRASLQKSLDTKRNLDTISDSITAEDIGKFPNTNVAEAMSLMPGVTIDRRFGQGERVSIDGTDPSLNLSFLDGHPVAQAIWLYGESPNRGFDYTMMAPEILGRLEVIKSSEARLPEGSLGGTVLMHSRKPLDMDANTISGTVGYSYNDQAEGGKPNVSALYSWKNTDSTFGFDIAAQHFEERIDRQGLEIFGYSPVSAFAAVNPNIAAQVAAGELRPNDMVPQEVNAAYFQQTRKRDSALFNLQFKPNDQFSADLSGLYIKENFDSYNQSMYNFMTQNTSSMQAVDSFTPTTNGVVSGGHTSANPGSGTGLIYDNQLRQSEVTTKGVDLRADYNADSWTLGGQVGMSKSDNPNINQYLLEPTYQGSYGWNINKGFQADDQAAVHDPANWGGGWLGNNGKFASHAKDQYAQLDFSKNFDSVINQLLLGVRYNKHNEDYALHVYGGVTPGTLADVGTIGDTDILDALPGIYDNTGKHIQVGAGNIQNWINNSSLDFSNPDPGSTINNTWQLEQKNTAAYAQLNFSTDNLRGNVGVRWVHTKTASTAYTKPNDAAPVLPAPASWWGTTTNTKNNFLPSVNLVYDNGGDVVLRAAASKVMAWAPYNLMVNQTFLNDTVLTGSGGSPSIDPYKSYNFNVSAEWYFAPQSVLAGSVFFKHVLNYILITPGTEVQYNSIRDTDPTTWSALVGSHGCTADGFCDYSVSRPHNGGGARVKGFTLNYQQAFGETGFGLIANYTFATGKTNAGTSMPYLSRNSVSVSPYYENGAFSGRVNYNWRSKYQGVGYVAGAPAATTDDYTDVSASVGWTFNPNFSLSLDALNLTNQKYFQYTDTPNLPNAKYTTGRRYMASLHFKF